MTDITERKRAERERDQLESLLRQAYEGQMADEVLRRSEEQFRAPAEHPPDVIDRFDREMRHVYVNPVGLRLRGKEARDVIGKTIRETGVPEPYCTLREEELQKVFATGEVGEIEGLFPTVDGMKFYQSSLVPEYDSEGGIAFVLVVSRDVTERTKAEEALRESEQHYRSLFDAAYSPRRGCFVSVFDVITERKRTEEALWRSHEELERRVLERTEALRRQADSLELA